jgi:hypothetical protein
MGTALVEGGSARRVTYLITQPTFGVLVEQPVQGV